MIFFIIDMIRVGFRRWSKDKFYSTRERFTWNLSIFTNYVNRYFLKATLFALVCAKCNWALLNFPAFAIENLLASKFRIVHFFVHAFRKWFSCFSVQLLYVFVSIHLAKLTRILSALFNHVSFSVCFDFQYLFSLFSVLGFVILQSFSNLVASRQ